MAYKRYIKKGGKIYGPYVYHSSKKDGKVVSKYLGKHTEEKNSSLVNVLVFLFIGLFLFSGIVLMKRAFVEDVSFSPEEKFSLSVDQVAVLGEQITGSVKINLFAGELIPASTSVLIDNVGDENNFLLSDLVSNEIVEGNFYLGGVDLSGYGSGYGIPGEKTIYPDVSFTLLIKSEKILDGEIIAGGGSPGSDVPETPEEPGPSPENDTQPDEPSENVTSPGSSSGSGIVEPEISVVPSEPVGEVPMGESVEEPEVPAEEPMEEKEVPVEPVEPEVPKEEPAKKTSSEPEVMGSPNELVIENIVSGENNFVYNLIEGESAEIVSSSETVNLVIENGKVIVSTDYTESESGFGEDYVTDEVYEMTIDLSQFDLIFSELGDFKFDFNFGDIEVASLTKNLEILDEELVLDENVTILNETNFTLAGKIDQFILSKNLRVEQKILDKLLLDGKSRVIIKTRPGMDSIGKKLSGLEDYEVIELNEFNLELLNVLNIEELVLDQPLSLLLEDSDGIIKSFDSRNEFGVDGSGKKICIIDTGVDYNHADIGNYAYGYDFVNEDDDPLDDNGHGTSVAGIVSKIAPGSELVVAKVIDSSGVGYESDVLEGLQYCINENADIISFSIGAGSYSGACDSNIVAELVNSAVDSGIFVVAATGNDGSSRLKSPSCATNAVRVSASTKADGLASFSNINEFVDVLAPGENINVPVLGGGYSSKDGTSLSAPMIAGAAALVLEYGALEPLELRYRFASTGKPVLYNNEINISRLDVYNAIINNVTMIPFGYELNETINETINETYEVLLDGTYPYIENPSSLISINNNKCKLVGTISLASDLDYSNASINMRACRGDSIGCAYTGANLCAVKICDVDNSSCQSFNHSISYGSYTTTPLRQVTEVVNETGGSYDVYICEPGIIGGYYCHADWITLTMTGGFCETRESDCENYSTCGILSTFLYGGVLDPNANCCGDDGVDDFWGSGNSSGCCCQGIAIGEGNDENCGVTSQWCKDGIYCSSGIEVYFSSTLIDDTLTCSACADGQKYSNSLCDSNSDGVIDGICGLDSGLNLACIGPTVLDKITYYYGGIIADASPCDTDVTNGGFVANGISVLGSCDSVGEACNKDGAYPYRSSCNLCDINSSADPLGDSCDTNVGDASYNVQGICTVSGCATGVVKIASVTNNFWAGCASGGEVCDNSVSNGVFSATGACCGGGCVSDGTVGNGGSCCGDDDLCQTGLECESGDICGLNLGLGEVCNLDGDCASGKCKLDFDNSSGVKYCINNQCPNDPPVPIVNWFDQNYVLCSGDSWYKNCSGLGGWGSQIDCNSVPENDFCTPPGETGANCGWKLTPGDTCNSGIGLGKWGCLQSSPICTDCGNFSTTSDISCNHFGEIAYCDKNCGALCEQFEIHNTGNYYCSSSDSWERVDLCRALSGNCEWFDNGVLNDIFLEDCGDGTCGYYLDIAPCVGGICQDCPTNCNTDGDCDFNGHCSGGICIADLLDGATCDRNGSCQSDDCNIKPDNTWVCTGSSYECSNSSSAGMDNISYTCYNNDRYRCALESIATSVDGFGAPDPFEDCATKSSYDSDGANNWDVAGYVYDYLDMCIGTSCNYTIYRDYCSGVLVYDQRAIGASFETTFWNTSLDDTCTGGQTTFRDYYCTTSSCPGGSCGYRNFTDRDRDNAQAYCEQDSGSCDSQYWVVSAGTCCGDDGLSDNFCDNTVGACVSGVYQTDSDIYAGVCDCNQGATTCSGGSCYSETSILFGSGTYGNCCGDDGSGENYLESEMDKLYVGCCNSSAGVCVGPDNCYLDGQNYSEQYYCDAGTWYPLVVYNNCTSEYSGANLIVDESLTCDSNNLIFNSLTVESGGELTLDGVSLMVGKTLVKDGGKFFARDSKGTIWQNENLTISGEYVLDNSTLRMNGTAPCGPSSPCMGDVSIKVNGTGNFTIRNSAEITHGDYFLYRYELIVESGAAFGMENSALSYSGASFDTIPLNRRQFPGVEIFPKVDIFRGNTFSYNHKIVFYAENNLLENNTLENNIWSSSSGFFLGRNNNLVKNNVFENMSGVGVLLNPSSINNTLEGNIFLNGESGIQIPSQGNFVRNNTFINNSLRGINLNFHGANLVEGNYFDSNYQSFSFFWADGSLLKDSVISNSVNGSIYMESLYNPATLYVLNTTFEKEKVGFNNEGGPSTGLLDVAWYLNVNVTDEFGNSIDVASVKGYNVTGDLAFSELTNSGGFITQQNVTEYVQNITAKYFQTNYTINVTKEGYFDYITQLNLTESTRLDVVLNAVPAVSNVVLNSSSGMNSTLDNLNVYYDNSSDTDTVISDWRVGGNSIAVLNIPFDTGISGVQASVKDYSSYGNDGVLGNITPGTQPIWTSEGKIGGAYKFDGLNDYIDCGTDSSLDLTEQMSVEVWIKPAMVHEGGGNYGVLSKALNPSWSWQLRFGGEDSTTGDSDNLGFQFNKGGGTSDSVWVNLDQSLGVDQWYHVVGIYNGTDAMIYLNGVLNDTNSLSNIQISSVPFLIGNEGWPGNHFNGTIDGVRVYNRSLSEEQINVNYQAGLVGKSPELLVSQETKKDDVWSVALTPNDGYGDGETVLSNDLLVVNLPPEVESVVLGPAIPYTKDDLNCVFNATDSESLVLEASVFWYKDGINFLNQTISDYVSGTSYSSNLSHSFTNNGVFVYCNVSVSDFGGGFSEEVKSNEVTVQEYNTNLVIFNESEKVINQDILFTANYSETDFGFGDIKEKIFQSNDLGIDHIYDIIALDFDEDGIGDDFIAVMSTGASGRGEIFAYDGEGGVVSRWNASGDGYLRFAAAADYDFDGFYEGGIFTEGFVEQGYHLYNNVGAEIIQGTLGSSSDIARANNGTTDLFYLSRIDSDNVGYLSLVLGDGNVLCNNFVDLGIYWEIKEMRAFDIDGDGFKEGVIILHSNGAANGKPYNVAVEIFNESCEKVFEYQYDTIDRGYEYGGTDLGLGVGDVDNDGSNDFVFKEVTGWVNSQFLYFNRSFDNFRNVSVPPNLVNRVSELIFSDIDNDGFEDDLIVAQYDSGSDTSLYGVRAFQDGINSYWNASATNKTYYLDAEDFNDDGIKDFSIFNLWSSDDEPTVFILDGETGNISYGYYTFSSPTNVNGGTDTALEGVDVNGDGIKEIVVGDDAAFVYVFQEVSCNITFNDSVSSDMAWDESNGVWNYSRNFSMGGLYDYNITCDKGGYVLKTEFGTVNVSDNTLPIVNLLSPADDSLNSSRVGLEFVWEGVDAQNDPLTYQLNLSCYYYTGSPCGDTRNLSFGPIAPGQYNHIITNPFEYLHDNNYYYTWKVRANDGFGWGDWSEEWDFNITSFVSINLTRDVVDFGPILPDSNEDTLDNVPPPMLLENTGNCFVNVTLNATTLWETPGYENPTDYFLYKIDDRTEFESFNKSLSQMIWAPAPDDISPFLAIALFNWSANSDVADIDLNITVPPSESAGSKNSLITFIASLAE